MQIGILADDQMKQEILQKGFSSEVEVIWVDTLKSLVSLSDATIYMDFLFEPDPDRISLLRKLQADVVINSVVHTLNYLDVPFIRINGWHTMINRRSVEVVFAKDHVSHNLNDLGWQLESVQDIIGMVTPRVIATIVNEAYFALEDKVSAPAAIDTAMKLGTNYPFGPFEWSQKIGLQKIAVLLKALSRADPRYTPSTKLLQELS